MTRNYTPLDIPIQDAKSRAVSRVTVALFVVATLTVLVFAVTISVVFQRRAQAQDTITLPPVDITTSATE